MKKLYSLLLLLVVCAAVLPTVAVWAQDFPSPYQLAEPLPGSTDRNINSLADYLNLAYVSLLSAAITFGLVMLVYSGVEYMTAGGNQSAIGSAKERMKRIAYGFLIIIGAVLILQTLGGDSFLKINFTIERTSVPATDDRGTGGTADGNNPGTNPN